MNLKKDAAIAWCLWLLIDSGMQTSVAQAQTLAVQDKVHLISQLDEEKSLTDQFRQNFIELGFPIKDIQCTNFVELSQDGKDRSFGGYCHISSASKQREVMVCDDTMIGKFTIKAWGFASSVDDLSEFIKNNCPGGG